MPYLPAIFILVSAFLTGCATEFIDKTPQTFSKEGRFLPKFFFGKSVVEHQLDGQTFLQLKWLNERMDADPMLEVEFLSDHELTVEANDVSLVERATSSEIPLIEVLVTECGYGGGCKIYRPSTPHPSNAVIRLNKGQSVLVFKFGGKWQPDKTYSLTLGGVRADNTRLPVVHQNYFDIHSDHDHSLTSGKYRLSREMIEQSVRKKCFQLELKNCPDVSDLEVVPHFAEYLLPNGEFVESKSHYYPAESGGFLNDGLAISENVSLSLETPWVITAREPKPGKLQQRSLDLKIYVRARGGKIQFGPDALVVRDLATKDLYFPESIIAYNHTSDCSNEKNRNCVTFEGNFSLSRPHAYVGTHFLAGWNPKHIHALCIRNLFENGVRLAPVIFIISDTIPRNYSVAERYISRKVFEKSQREIRSDMQLAASMGSALFEKDGKNLCQ